MERETERESSLRAAKNGETERESSLRAAKNVSVMVARYQLYLLCTYHGVILSKAQVYRILTHKNRGGWVGKIKSPDFLGTSFFSNKERSSLSAPAELGAAALLSQSEELCSS